MTELAASIREFLSTPSARRATALYVDQSLLSEISIHALREEGDERICVHSSESGNFYPRPPRGGRPLFAQGRPHHTVISIHALREEGDVTTVNYPHIIRKFLSTPSARRATHQTGTH